MEDIQVKLWEETGLDVSDHELLTDAGELVPPQMLVTESMKNSVSYMIVNIISIIMTHDIILK